MTYAHPGPNDDAPRKSSKKIDPETIVPLDGDASFLPSVALFGALVILCGSAVLNTPVYLTLSTTAALTIAAVIFMLVGAILTYRTSLGR